MSMRKKIEIMKIKMMKMQIPIILILNNCNLLTKLFSKLHFKSMKQGMGMSMKEAKKMSIVMIPLNLNQHLKTFHCQHLPGYTFTY